MTFGDNRPNVVVGKVEFKYAQPNIAVSTGARYATHKPIGDVVVRQKLGPQPEEVTIDGICTEEEANQVDKLPKFEDVQVISNRWSGQAQVTSTDTDPMEDGGALDKDEEWLHTFSIALVKVSTGSATGTGAGGPGQITIE